MALADPHDTSFSPDARRDLLARLTDLAAQAGSAILRYYGGPDEALGAVLKADGSPVTAADQAAETIILEGLARLAPGIPVVAEESVAAGREPEVGDGPFWLVDPLDGTKEFLNRNGEFTVNIGLVEHGRPILGVVHAPALALSYLGSAGLGAWRILADAGRGDIAVRPVPADGVTVVASRSHGSPEEIRDLLKGRPVAGRRAVGSSLKFCLVAAGEADLYPRYGRTMEWDTAAGQAVLEAAGGHVATKSGQLLRYGKPGFENPEFIASGGI